MNKANFLSAIKFKVLLSGFLGVIFFSCLSNSKQQAKNAAEGDSTKVWLELKVAQYEDGWGYQILQGEHVYIDQPFIPAISGYHRFVNEEEAQRVGKFLLNKLERGEGMTITVANIDSLQITH